MKYAIISDVHGNYPALCAVLKDAKQAKIDKYIFVGDYALSLPYPNEIVDEIIRIQNSYIVRGNEENYIKNLSTQDKSLWTDGQLCTLYWSYNALTEKNRQYLMQLPKQINFADGNIKISIAHSSEDFIGKTEHEEFSSSKTAMKYLNKPFTHQILNNDINKYLRSNLEFQEIMNNLTDGIYIFGHTHIQWYASFNRKTFINPGSCGLALDFSLKGAPYTILNIENDKIDIDERHVPFDKEAVIQELKSSELYRQATVWSNVIISELRTCREHAQFFLKYAEKYANSIDDNVRPYSLETWENAYKSWKQSGDYA
jgi:predicted phosphodiesterase